MLHRARQTLRALAKETNHRAIWSVILQLAPILDLEVEQAGSQELKEAHQKQAEAVDEAVSWAENEGRDPDSRNRRFEGIPEEIEQRVRVTATEFCLAVFDHELDRAKNR